MKKKKETNVKDILSLSNDEYKFKNDEFRKYYWYDCLNHISERTIRSEEYLLNKFLSGDIDLSYIEELNNDELKLNNFLKDFNYRYESEHKDVQRTLYILIDYIKLTAS